MVFDPIKFEQETSENSHLKKELEQLKSKQSALKQNLLLSATESKKRIVDLQSTTQNLLQIHRTITEETGDLQKKNKLLNSLKEQEKLISIVLELFQSHFLIKKEKLVEKKLELYKDLKKIKAFYDGENPLPMEIIYAKTVDAAYDEIKEILTEKLNQILIEISWPKFTRIHEVDFERIFVLFCTLEGRGQLETHPAFDTLSSHYRMAFEYHFKGKRPTNQLEHPEYYLSFVQKILVELQGLFKELQILLRENSICINVSLEFQKSLCTVVKKKIAKDTKKIQADPTLFLHLVTELEKFDDNLRLLTSISDDETFSLSEYFYNQLNQFPVFMDHLSTRSNDSLTESLQSKSLTANAFDSFSNSPNITESVNSFRLLIENVHEYISRPKLGQSIYDKILTPLFKRYICHLKKAGTNFTDSYYPIDSPIKQVDLDKLYGALNSSVYMVEYLKDSSLENMYIEVSSMFDCRGLYGILDDIITEFDELSLSLANILAEDIWESLYLDLSQSHKLISELHRDATKLTKFIKKSDIILENAREKTLPDSYELVAVELSRMVDSLMVETVLLNEFSPEARTNMIETVLYITNLYSPGSFSKSSSVLRIWSLSSKEIISLKEVIEFGTFDEKLWNFSLSLSEIHKIVTKYQ
jgi:hypothetical protein